MKNISGAFPIKKHGNADPASPCAKNHMLLSYPILLLVPNPFPPVFPCSSCIRSTSCFASSKLVWYTGRSDSAEDIIKGYDHSYDADHYNILFDKDIIDIIADNKDRFTDFEIIKGSMDDVFLNLTGRMIAN